MTLDSKMINQILCLDCVDGMKQLPDGCIPLTVTSPPYDNLRDYGGHPFTFEPIADELFRITAEGGVVVWVVQDQVIDGGESGTSCRQQIYFQHIGFRVHHRIVLHPRGQRNSLPLRYGNAVQLALILSKGHPRYINLIRDRLNECRGRVRTYNMRKKDGQIETQATKVTADYGIRRQVWEYAVGGRNTAAEAFSAEQPARMPEGLAEDLIISFSKPGDLVFDPMAGSGTTLKMALLNDRKFLGMEIHQPYHEIAVKRLELARQQHKQKLDDFLWGCTALRVHPVPQPEQIASKNGKASKKPFVPYTAKTTIRQGDVLEVLRMLDDNSFDGVLTDPPYALTSIRKRYGGKNAKPPRTDVGAEGTYGRHARGFMGQLWDSNVPTEEVWAELLRVCKPGACLLSFGFPRTFHRLMVNIEDAGWEIRDTLMWLYGQGFPKSHSIANDIDKRLGRPNRGHAIACGSKYDPQTGKERLPGEHLPPYQAKTPEAKPWEGYGIALKPAYEPIILAMKPRDGSFANNALTWGLAGLNIDGCRIGASGDTKGRFPANVILDEELPSCSMNKPLAKSATVIGRKPRPPAMAIWRRQFRISRPRQEGHRARAVHPGYFYCAKASKRERNCGLRWISHRPPRQTFENTMGIFDQHGIQPQQNSHPCVKPLDLCRYISTLILPPERESARRLLVPYCGTGSEMIGAMQAGWDEVLGIELSPDYIARAETD